MGATREDSEVRLTQFNKLISELLRGTIVRNCFRPWEIELLLDIETCNLRDGNKKEILRRYQRFVQRKMEKGAPAPLKLSEYLEDLKARRTAQSLRKRQVAGQLVTPRTAA
jgi:hypothetical protein